MLNDVFYTDKYDSNVFIKNNNETYTVFDFKELIKTKCEEIENKNKNVVIFEDDNFSFIINFFASIFTKKSIYLLDSKQKIQNLDFEYHLLDSKISNKKSDFKLDKIDINEPCVNFYTSGTTTKPKIFQKSLFNLLKEASDIKEELKIEDENLEFITTTILQHLFSITFFLMFSFVNIDKNYIINTDKIYYPDNINTKNSLLVSTPAFLDKMKKYNIDSKQGLKYIISAGSKLDNDTFSYLEKFLNVVEIYGSTETGVISYKRKPDDNMTLFKNVEIKKENNETIIKSNYFPEDFIKINDEIELVGRKLIFKKRKDKVLKIYDKRIYSDEIEEVLQKNENISKAYCFKYDEKLACCAVLSDTGKDFVIKNGVFELKKHLKQYSKKYFEIIPQKWRFVDEMPTNIRGKIDREYIEKLFGVNFSFPCILDRKNEEKTANYKILFSRDLKFFKGHFPDFPIVAGVVQLYLAEFLVKNSFSKDFCDFNIKKLKFSNIIKPDSIVNLKLEKIDNNIKFEYSNENHLYSSAVFCASQKGASNK